jgi:hypothetical protein
MTVRLSRTARSALFALVVATMACSDAATLASPGETLPPPPVLSGSANYIINVDLVRGEITATPVTPALTDGMVSARFYGTSQQIAYRFAQPVSAPQDSGGKRIWTLQARVENRLDHRVGTHQMSGTVTSPGGVTVYVAIPPVPTAGCAPFTPSCSAAIYGPDGKAAFSDLNQSYWFYNQYLEANDGVPNSGPDLSGVKSWRFIADPAVTNFAFGVSVKASWGLESEVVVINWNGSNNPLLGTGGPTWSVQGDAAPVMVSDPSLCGGQPQCLQVTTNNSAMRVYRTDVLLPSQSAFMEGTVIGFQIANGNHPNGVLGFWDGVKYMQVGVSGTHIGFTNATSTSLFSSVQYHMPSTPVDLRLVKNAATGQVSLFRNGVLALSAAYSAFPAAPYVGAGPHPSFWFGNDGSGTTRWTNVSYGIGTTSP